MLKLDRKMMVYYFLIFDAKIFGKLIVFWKCCKIAVLVGSEYAFQDGMVIAHSSDHFFNELFVLDEVLAAQVKYPRSISVDEIMDLLGQAIIIGHVDNQVWKHFNGFFLLQGFLDFPYSGGGVAKYHGHP